MFVLLLLSFSHYLLAYMYAEICFSKLKYIKNYLRNSMAQERIGLILSVEAVRSKVMDVDR